MSPGALPGFRDFYPTELAERAYLFGVWREIARRFGFVEYDGPPLEPLELYTRKSGEEIVGQLYSFTDKGDREVSLRPEMTPTLARMVAARAAALRKPVRWFSIPQLFRYERQQRGRLREHFQLNMDIVGEADVSADAELLAAAIEIMRALGLAASDVVARVSDRRIIEAYLASLGATGETLGGVFAVIDKLGRQPTDVSERKLQELGLGAKAIAKVIELPHTRMEKIRPANGGGRDAAGRFDRYLGYLSALGVESDWLRVDLTVVRGLAYYTGIVFELFDAKGALRAICGGGRYDDLLGAIGGADLPALGFGMGDVVLTELLRERGLLKTAPLAVDFWVAGDASTPESLAQLMTVAAALRRAGASAEYPLRDQSLDKQRKAAKQLGATSILTLSEGFSESKEVEVQPLAGTAEPAAVGRMTLEALVGAVRRRPRPSADMTTANGAPTGARTRAHHSGS
ncbi:MAG TPA: histidine--tRNA ligase [Gemmatimonadaceae bacterium]|nr:histidine--tRNA ligase [Gemmatimonadaceae bacterium]